MFIATRAARSAKLRRSGMFIGTPNQQRSAPSSVRSGMEPFVWSPIRHAAPDGAWFSGGCASAINMRLLRSYAGRAAPDSSVRSGMFIVTRAARSAKLRRSGMFIGTGTNNGLRQAPSGAAWNHSSAPQSDMPLLTELGSRGVRLSYKHAAPTELWATGRPRLGGCSSAINMSLLRSYGRRAVPRQLRQERHGTIRLLPNPTCRS